MSSALSRPKPEFYDDVMRFVEQFKSAKSGEEQNVVIRAWSVWKNINGVMDEDWANIRFLNEMQAEIIRVQKKSIEVYENMLDTYQRSLAAQTDKAEKMAMYSCYLEEMFLGRPGPSDFPAS